MDNPTNAWPASFDTTPVSPGPTSAAPVTPPMLACYLCGRGPTTMISVSRGLGMIFLRRQWTYKAPLCRDHGTAVARNWLVATSLMGWWGIISFFVNWVSVAQDFNAWMAARRLAPAGSVIVPGSFGWTAPTTSPHVPRKQLLFFAGLILAVLGVGIYENAYGSRSIGGLGVGICFNEPPIASDVVSEVTSRPCNEVHESEVFGITNYPLPAGVPYPTEAQLASIAVNQCAPSFNSYVGGSEGLPAGVDFYYLSPTTAGWNKGDRRLVCYVHATNGATLTQSLRGAGHS